MTRGAGASGGAAAGAAAKSPAESPGSAGGTLYVVATPIGNLADVTLRALETLRSVPLIAAEDTRLTHRLLARHGIETRMTSYHARSGPARAAALLDHLRAGDDLALVADAGTPGGRRAPPDPGLELVAAWAAVDGTVVPIPGPSAVLAAVVASGVSGPRWAFEGFLPRSGRERRDRIARISADERGTVLYEAPGRVAATLADLAAACGPERPAAVCRELTKLHETIERGSLGGLAELAADGTIPARGEFTIVVGAAAVVDRRESRPGPDDALSAARAEVERLVGEGSGRAQAARRVAAATGLSRRKLYDVHGETGR